MRFKPPMLAKNFEDHEDEVMYPCFVQPKLDGVRCITNGQTFWSRNGKVFPRQNFKHLETAPFSCLLDGELSMESGRADFEDVVSIVKRVGHPDSHKICFNAFDVMNDEVYVQRKDTLKKIFDKQMLRYRSQRWKRVLTVKVHEPDKIDEFYKTCLAMGFEGVMIRNPIGLYVPKRTTDLLKWKPLKDEEFEIHDVIEAKGKDAGTPVFVCLVQRDKEGKPLMEYITFRARPKGTMEQRRKMWVNRTKLIGKMLTVEFQHMTKYGVPRFPRARVPRDYE